VFELDRFGLDGNGKAAALRITNAAAVTHAI